MGTIQVRYSQQQSERTEKTKEGKIKTRRPDQSREAEPQRLRLNPPGEAQGLAELKGAVEEIPEHHKTKNKRSKRTTAHTLKSNETE